MKPFKIIGLTRTERHLVIAQVMDAIQGCGGWIMDFNIFSNISICLNVEIGVDRIEALCLELEKIGIKLNRSGAAGDSALSEIASPDRPVTGTIQITFIHQEPDLRVEVPPIPG